MMVLQKTITKQAHWVMQSPQRALLCSVVFAIVPYCAWLSVVLVTLVTLRKGSVPGAQLLLWVMLAHALLGMITQPMSLALINTLLFFVPSFIAAWVLRTTSNWQMVALVLFVQVLLSALVVQLFIPTWVTEQYALIYAILKATHSEKFLNEWAQHSSAVSELVMANYVFGIQLMSAVISVLIALTTARSLQSRLYNPGEFVQEMLRFRGNPFAVVLMLVLGVAAFNLNLLAINTIPALALFYTMAGLSLCANLVLGKSARLTFLLLLIPLIALPFVMIPLYIIVGLLDSVFNLRLVFCR